VHSEPRLEPLWLPVAAVVSFMAINITLRLWLPSEGAIRTPWLLPTIEAVLLVVLVTSDPTGPAERRRLRRLALVLVGLLYWLVDGGGPRARLQHAVPVDFAFTQHMSPELAPNGWRPVFLDYLHLGFTNATAFSPTDVLPLTHRAKYAMLVQSTVALALFGLVVARAVNAFTSSRCRSSPAGGRARAGRPSGRASGMPGRCPPPASAPCRGRA
jgi:hypothetical protein